MTRHLRTAAVFGLNVPAGAMMGAASAWGGLAGAVAGIGFVLVLTGLAPVSWGDTLFPPADNGGKQ